MTEQELIKRFYEALERESQLPPEIRWQRMIDAGIIDEKGNVPLWDAFLGVIAVQRNGDGNKILHFRCLKRSPGNPGWGQVDVPRDTMLHYVGEEKKEVVTAHLDTKFNRWKKGIAIHVTPQQFLRIDGKDLPEDDLGELPTFTDFHPASGVA